MNDSRANELPVDARARNDPCRSGGFELTLRDRLTAIFYGESNEYPPA
jgi:hypothetical protein